MTLSLATQNSTESPKTTLIDDDDSSDSDPNFSRSYNSLRSEDLSDVSKDSSPNRRKNPQQMTNLQGFKISPTPTKADDKSSYLNEGSAPLRVTDLELEIPQMERLSSMNSLRLMPSMSTKALEEKIAESKKIYWGAGTKEAILKVGMDYSQQEMFIDAAFSKSIQFCVWSHTCDAEGKLQEHMVELDKDLHLLGETYIDSSKSYRGLDTVD